MKEWTDDEHAPGVSLESSHWTIDEAVDAAKKVLLEGPEGLPEDWFDNYETKGQGEDFEIEADGGDGESFRVYIRSREIGVPPGYERVKHLT